MNSFRGSTIGILGDGQLGRMLAHSAQRRGLRVHGFGQDDQSPLAQVTNRFTCAHYNDELELTKFRESCEWITSEFENVPLSALELTKCQPAAAIFKTAQDRLKEKQAAASVGMPTASFYVIDSYDDLVTALGQTKGEGVLKIRRFGYDGKGQWRISRNTDLDVLWENTPKADMILESIVKFDFETSVLVARNRSGQVVTFPCGENNHQQGILYQCIVPGRVTSEIEGAAQGFAVDLAESMALIGLLAIEFFVLSDGNLVFNEMAPRPHNSGHWTLEACDQSQFDVAVKALIGDPLRTPIQHRSAVMTNILGHHISVPKFNKNCYWHDYGKADPKTGRKMGHITQLI